MQNVKRVGLNEDMLLQETPSDVKETTPLTSRSSAVKSPTLRVFKKKPVQQSVSVAFGSTLGSVLNSSRPSHADLQIHSRKYSETIVKKS